MGRISPDKPASSCAGCLAWGVLPARFCAACETFGRLHPAGVCAACRRLVPIKKGYCRLCWAQASRQARGQVTVLEPVLRQVHYQQLFLAGLQRPRTGGPESASKGGGFLLVGLISHRSARTVGPSFGLLRSAGTSIGLIAVATAISPIPGWPARGRRRARSARRGAGPAG